MISGSADAVAVPSANQQPIFDQAPVPIVWGTHAGSSHLEVLSPGGGAYPGPLTAWFRYKLMGDAAAGQVFEKPDCSLCSQSGWTVQFNNLWMRSVVGGAKCVQSPSRRHRAHGAAATTFHALDRALSRIILACGRGGSPGRGLAGSTRLCRDQPNDKQLNRH